MNTRTRHVLVLSDDLPGHFNQSLGILKALRKYHDIRETRVSVRLRFGLARNLMRAYLNTMPGRPSLARLHLYYRAHWPVRNDFDLIVSAGGRTSFANAWLARTLQVPNIYAGSLRKLDHRLFTRVLTLEPVPGADNNLVLPIHASPVDSVVIEQAAVKFRSRRGLGDQTVWLLLVGGKGAGYRYQQADWQALGQLVNTLARQYGISWAVATSRRTGRRAEGILRENIDPRVLAVSCWAAAGDDFELFAHLGIAARVFVTEDSMTMVTEAVYSGRPVCSLSPAQARPEERYRLTMQRFADSGFICRYRTHELNAAPETLDSCHCHPMDDSPLEVLADQLRSVV